MIKSMTGYGSYEECNDICMQLWEIKSVNSKNLNVRFKIPSYLRSIEHVFLKEVKNVATRGNIDIYLTVKINKKDLLPFTINETLLDLLFDFLNNYAKKKGDVFVSDYNRVLSLPGLWSDVPLDASSKLVGILKDGLKKALVNWNNFREREGEHLLYDLRERLDKLAHIRDKIEEISSTITEEKFQLMRERIGEILGKTQIPLDEERLFQELAIMADKLDVSEELVRLDSHIKATKELLDSDVPIGRQMDFLCQECFREINTCGNKAQNVQVSSLVVEFKTELERIREQVQNLE